MAKNRAQQAAISIDMKKKGKKPKKKLKRGGHNLLKKYENAGYGQQEYGPNILSTAGLNENQSVYLQAYGSAYQQQAEAEKQQRESYLADIAAMNEAENQANLQKGTGELIKKFQKADGSNVKEKAKDLLKGQDVGSFVDSYNPILDESGQRAFQGIVDKGTQSVFNPTTGQGMSLNPGEAIPEGFQAVGAAAPSALTQAVGNFATNTAVGSSASSVGSTISPYALPAYIVGEGISYFADDDDETTWTAGEITGDVLSTTGKRTGQGAMIGSLAGPPGQAIGAAIGATIGLGESIFKGLRDRNEAREEEYAYHREITDDYNKFVSDKSDFMKNVGPSSSQYGTTYMGEMGGIKPMNSQGDMIVYGPTHEQGGVMRDANTELEGGGMKNGVAMPGEVITKVMDNNGSMREYYFSDHLKNPSTGNTFAEDYRKSGGMNMNAKQMFAKLQEKIASKDDKSRSPKNIAMNGGMGNPPTNQNVQMPQYLKDDIADFMSKPMSEEDKIRYSSLQMQRDASNYLENEGTLAGFQGPKEKSTAAKTAKFIAKEGLLDKAFHGLGRFAGVPGLMFSPLEAGASTVRDEYGLPVQREDGGMGEDLQEISKQLTKASQMHAAQSKRTGQLAKKLMKKAKGGYKMYANGDFKLPYKQDYFGTDASTPLYTNTGELIPRPNYYGMDRSNIQAGSRMTDPFSGSKSAIARGLTLQYGNQFGTSENPMATFNPAYLGDLSNPYVYDQLQRNVNQAKKNLATAVKGRENAMIPGMGPSPYDVARYRKQVEMGEKALADNFDRMMMSFGDPIGDREEVIENPFKKDPVEETTTTTNTRPKVEERTPDPNFEFKEMPSRTLEDVFPNKGIPKKLEPVAEQKPEERSGGDGLTQDADNINPGILDRLGLNSRQARTLLGMGAYGANLLSGRKNLNELEDMKITADRITPERLSKIRISNEAERKMIQEGTKAALSQTTDPIAKIALLSKQGEMLQKSENARINQETKANLAVDKENVKNALVSEITNVKNKYAADLENLQIQTAVKKGRIQLMDKFTNAISTSLNDATKYELAYKQMEQYAKAMSGGRNSLNDKFFENLKELGMDKKAVEELKNETNQELNTEQNG